MRVELEPEEVRELVSLVADRLLAEAGLGEKDRAQIRRWRSDAQKAGSQTTRTLTEKVNAELDRALKAKAKSAVRKPDWK